MRKYLLQHSHEPAECRIAFAAWRGYDSPLRHQAALATCAEGGHELWWTVEAGDQENALAQLPPYLAERTRALEVSEVPIP
jgi:hypothetical protein